MDIVVKLIAEITDFDILHTSGRSNAVPRYTLNDMISLRPMEDTMEDYELMKQWFADSEVKAWVWCDSKDDPAVSIERIIEKYRPRINQSSDVHPYFILHDQIPIGFIQSYQEEEFIMGIDV